MIRHYKTLTGRQVDLSLLNEREQKAAAVLIETWRKNPDWEVFSRRAQAVLKETLGGLPGGEVVIHPLYKVAHDLEMKLGIAQGKVSSPDYRDYLLDKIEERFGTRYSFCRETGISEAFLSQVFAGKKDVSLPMLRRMAKALGLELALLPASDIAKLPMTELVELRDVHARVSDDGASLRSLCAHLRRSKTPEKWTAIIENTLGSLASGYLEIVRERLVEISGEQINEKRLRIIDDEVSGLAKLQISLRNRIAALEEPDAVTSEAPGADLQRV